MNGQELATRFVEAFEKHDPVSLSAIFAQDAVFAHPFFPGGIRGRDAILAAEKPLFDGFSDIVMTVVSVTEADRRVAVEWSVSATNTGDLPLPDGSTLPATGRRVSLPGLDVFRLDEEGLAVEGHRYQDAASFMAQLGLA